MWRLWPRGASAAPLREAVSAGPPSTPPDRVQSTGWISKWSLSKWRSVLGTTGTHMESRSSPSSPQPSSRPSSGPPLGFAPLTKDGQVLRALWPLSLLSPPPEVLVVDNVCHRDRRRQVHYLAGQLADGKHWPLVYLRLAVFRISDACSHPQLMPQ